MLLVSALVAVCAVAASNRLESNLADAAQAGDQARIRELLQSGANVNASQPDGMTALHWAAQNDDATLARKFIAAGADVNASNRYGIRPIIPSSINGNEKILNLFLEAGADPNTECRGGETALMLAARTGNPAAVQTLLNYGADVNSSAGDTGQTALMWAAAEGYTEAVRQLLDAGADLNSRIESGFTAFLFAVREGRLDTVRLLLELGADANEEIETRRIPREGRPRNGSTALMIATRSAHFEVGAALLEAGADPNASGPGYTALHLMASVRKPGGGDNDPPPDGSGSMTSLEFVKAMAEYGANLNARMAQNVNLGNTRLTRMGVTPFFLAAHAADADLMRTLADLGADPLISNKDRATPLMVAAGLGTRSPGEDAGTEPEVLEAAQVALELGNDINGVDGNGETVMHGAAYKNLPKVVEWVAANGADIKVWNKRNNWGWTPLEIAEGYRFGNFKPSPVTIEAVRKVMWANGVNPDANRLPVKSHEIY